MLHVGGGMTFTFKGLNCHRSGQTVLGWFGAVSPVLCKDISDLVQYEPNMPCLSEHDCPEDRLLSKHDAFKFKIGRASLRSLPAVGKEAADRYGCEVVAANVNIGSEGKDPIYREFVFVGRREDCDYAVDRGTVEKDFTLDRALAIGSGTSELARSDFTGKAWLLDSGDLRVRPLLAPATRFDITLPGKFEADCKGKRGASGWLIPVDAAKCGEVPDPEHDTTPDDVGLQRCRDFARAHGDVLLEVGRLRYGRYDDLVKMFPDPTGPDEPYHGQLVYHQALELLHGREGEFIERAVFVGKTNRGVPVVSFCDMRVLDYGHFNGRPYANVRFLSDPCAFDADLNPVLVEPVGCRETLPYRWLEAVLHPRGFDWNRRTP
jgi:hypothetical protein